MKQGKGGLSGAGREAEEGERRSVRLGLGHACGQGREGGGDDALVWTGGVHDNRHGRVGCGSVHHQAALDEAGRFLAHVDRGDLAWAGQRLPVVIGEALHVVPREQAHRGVAAAPGQHWPMAATAALAAVMPGTMVHSRPAASSASISSSSRPNTVQSPPLRRTTCAPCNPCSTISALI